MNFGRSVIIAELWRPEVARPGNFVSNFCVSWKRPLMAKFSKFCFESLHSNTDRRCCVEISWNLSDGKSAKSCVIYLTKNKQKFACLSNCRYCVDRAQNLQESAPNNLLAMFQISSKSVHFRRSYYRTREHRFLPRIYIIRRSYGFASGE